MMDFIPTYWPRCAVCGKPVEQLQSWRDPVNGDVISAKCHGSSETVFLRDSLEEGPLTLIGGTAFQSERNRLNRLPGHQVND